MTARNLLLVTPQLPYPPEQGAALRNYHILRHLTRHAKVSLVSFGSGEVPAPLRDLCRAIAVVPVPRRPAGRRLAELLAPRPDLALRLRSPAFSTAVRHLCQQETIDLVQCEALELFPAVEGLTLPVIYDAHNAEWRLQQRAYAAARHQRRMAAALYSLLQWQKLARYEARALRRAAATVAVSKADQGDLQRLAPGVQPLVVRNGVDPTVYTPLDSEPEEEGSILFAGKMDFRPNVEGAVWLATRVLPLVWRARPTARLILFGMAPTPAVRALASDPRIVVTGYVPGAAAERQALARAAVVAVPLLSGGGTRLKVLHALAMARPLVATPLGAAGYDLRAEQELLLAGSAEGFAQSILRLFADRPLARRLGAAGRQRVVECYAWERLLPTLERLHAELTHG